MIDTPGIMDTAPVSVMGIAKEIFQNVTGLYNESQKEILREIHKVFVMSPDGLDAVIIIIKYGVRFGLEDAEALKILKKFFGTEAQPYMILVLTHSDQAARAAKRENRTIEDQLKRYLSTLPDWVQRFMKEIGERRILFDNNLDPTENPDDCKKQVSNLIQVKVHFESKSVGLVVVGQQLHR